MTACEGETVWMGAVGCHPAQRKPCDESLPHSKPPPSSDSTTENHLQHALGKASRSPQTECQAPGPAVPPHRQEKEKEAGWLPRMRPQDGLPVPPAADALHALTEG